jgi:uncharacterized membrane protein
MRSQDRQSVINRRIIVKAIRISAVIAALVLITGCGNTTGARVASGTAMGVATGAIIGSLTAEAGAGALIGAGVGALGGYLVDQHKEGNL